MAPAIRHAPTIDINVARTMIVVLLPSLEPLFEALEPSPLSMEELMLLGDALLKVVGEAVRSGPGFPLVESGLLLLVMVMVTICGADV